MEEAAPIGSHIVVMDDNIENLLVEIPDDSIIAQRKAAGINEHSSWPLKFENFLQPFNGHWSGGGRGARAHSIPARSISTIWKMEQEQERPEMEAREK